MKTSVAMCTYNGEKFIKAQLESILNQTVPLSEIIICDDGSNDKTIQIIQQFQLVNPKIILHINKINLGSNKNFEKSISFCSGDFIFLSDQDDIWRNDKVEKTLAIFNQNPRAEGVFSNANLIDDKGNVIFENISIWDFFLFYESKMSKPINLFDFLISNGNFLTGATLCIRKEVKDFCFPFQTAKKFLHDEWFALILSKRQTLYYTTEKLLFYRLHNSQQLGIGDIKRSIREQDLILKLERPKSFRDYKFLTNIYFSQYERYKDLKYQNSNTLITTELINRVIELYTNFDLDMKKRYPIRYFFRKRKNEKKGRKQIDI